MSFINDNKNDNYITNKKAWEDIKKFIPKNKIIWSPFYCDGKQKEYFKDLDLDIIHIDKDFFSYTPEFDIIIDNIPFSKKRQIFKKVSTLFVLIFACINFRAKGNNFFRAYYYSRNGEISYKNA